MALSMYWLLWAYRWLSCSWDRDAMLLENVWDYHFDPGTNVIDVTGPPEANILWRWMGARAVPHLPCRFNCTDTVGGVPAFSRPPSALPEGAVRGRP